MFLRNNNTIVNNNFHGNKHSSIFVITNKYYYINYRMDKREQKNLVRFVNCNRHYSLLYFDIKSFYQKYVITIDISFK